MSSLQKVEYLPNQCFFLNEIFELLECQGPLAPAGGLLAMLTRVFAPYMLFLVDLFCMAKRGNNLSWEGHTRGYKLS